MAAIKVPKGVSELTAPAEVPTKLVLRYAVTIWLAISVCIVLQDFPHYGVQHFKTKHGADYIDWVLH
jgi:hypothetical protein